MSCDPVLSGNSIAVFESAGVSLVVERGAMQPIARLAPRVADSEKLETGSYEFEDRRTIVATTELTDLEKEQIPRGVHANRFGIDSIAEVLAMFTEDGAINVATAVPSAGGDSLTVYEFHAEAAVGFIYRAGTLEQLADIRVHFTDEETEDLFVVFHMPVHDSGGPNGAIFETNADQGMTLFHQSYEF